MLWAIALILLLLWLAGLLTSYTLGGLVHILVVVAVVIVIIRLVQGRRVVT
ncbi:MAG: lmo0937 family membrane protein [Phycisphaerae bacterium]